MRINYSPTFADYVAFNFHVARQQLRTISIVAAVLLVLFLICPLLPSRSFEGKGLIDIYQSALGLLILPGIVGFLFFATYWSARKRWSAAEELREQREYDFEETGVRVRMKSGESFTDWKVFKQAIVSKRFVYLRTAQRQFHFLPVATVPDLSALRELLGAKVAGSKNA